MIDLIVGLVLQPRHNCYDPAYKKLYYNRFGSERSHPRPLSY